MEKWAECITKWIGSTASVILHSVIFVISFLLPIFGWVSFERMLLVLTTMVSLEAIYLSIFIQISINMNNERIDIIREDIEEIQEDVEEIGEDIGEIQEDVDEMQEGNGQVHHISLRERELLVTIQDTLLSLQKEIELLKMRD